MDQLPKISIITPSYNQGQFIEETILSVINQNYPNLEYIIIDGGSTDNTVEIIKKYEKHLTYWCSEKDKGQSDAINKGFKRATGDVINWLNSDDYYQPETLLKVGKAFVDKNVNVYCGTCKLFGIGVDHFSNGTDVYWGNLEKTLAWARIDQPETFFRRTCLEQIGWVDERFHYLMDREMWFRYLLVYGLDGIVKTKEWLVNFRVHESSKTHLFQERFEKEGYSFYYSFFKKHQVINDFSLWEKLNVMEIPLDYENLSIRNDIDYEKIKNYYYCLRFLESYALNNYKLAKLYRPYISAKKLEAEDLANYKRVSLRMKYLPVFLKKILNRF